MAKEFDVTRRLALGGMIAGGAYATSLLSSSTAEAFNVCVGGLCTDDIKNVGKMLGSAQINEDDEIRIGESYFGSIVDALGGSYANRSVQSAMDRFSATLFATSTRPAFSWDIVVIDNDAVNAWALPGGKIGVNKGLLRYAANEHELAAVLAHEMGHVDLSHAVAEMKKADFVEGFSGLAGKALVSELEGGGAAAAGVLKGPLMRLVVSGYAREHEEEADAHIASVFDRTGHDLVKGAQFYQTMLQTIPKKSKGRTSLFAGHPDTKKRYELIMEAAAGRSSGTAGNSAAFADLKKPFPTRYFYKRDRG